MACIRRCSVAGRLSVVSWDGPTLAEAGCAARAVVAAVGGSAPRLVSTFTLRVPSGIWWRPSVFVDGSLIEVPSLSKLDFGIDPDLGVLWRGSTTLGTGLWDGRIHVVTLVAGSMTSGRRLVTCEASFYTSSSVRPARITGPESPILHERWSTRP